MKADAIVIQKLTVDVHVSWHDNPEQLLQEVVEKVNKELLPRLEAGLQGLPANRYNTGRNPEGPLFLPGISIDQVGVDLEVGAEEEWVDTASVALREGVEMALEQMFRNGQMPEYKQPDVDLDANQSASLNASGADLDPVDEPELENPESVDVGVSGSGIKVLESVSGLKVESYADRLKALWFSFLSSGQLPWWKEGLGVKRLADLEQLSLEVPTIGLWGDPDMLALVEHDPAAGTRFSKQLSFPVHEAIFQQTSLPARKRLLTVLQTHGTLSPRLEKVVLASLNQAEAKTDSNQDQPASAAKKRPIKGSRNKLVEGDFNLGTEVPAGLEQETGEAQLPVVGPGNSILEQVSEKLEEAEPCYFFGAGLVLLHPFIPSLLHRIGLTDEEGTWQSETAQEDALHALHHLVAGNWEGTEDEMVLAKVLLGWDDQAVPGRMEKAPDWEADLLSECEEILDQVHIHWPVMKNCTWEGLAVDFLQRPGKLSQGENGFWKLQMESKTADMLLRRLGWGLSPIKLPWMDKLLMVEWN